MEKWNLTALTVKEVAEILNCSPSTIYRDSKGEDRILDFDRVGKSGKRFNYWKHLIPYKERDQKKKPRPQKLSGKKGNLKHLDLT